MKRNSAIMNSDTDKICNDIKNKLLNKFDNDIEGIILFGSASRNELKEDSDIDIAVITSDQEENIMTLFFRI